MTNRITFLRKLVISNKVVVAIAIVLFSFLATSCSQDNTKHTFSGIKPWPENPYYWQYNGEPVILIGGSDDDNLFQWEKPELTQHLDLLSSVGGNFIRNTMSNRDSGNVDPFLKLENGLFDLDQWNQVYWERFQNLLELTSERDIIVQIEFWDQHDWYNERWNERSFNPENNINYTSEESGLPTKIDFGPLHGHGQANDHPFFLAHLPDEGMDKVLTYQEKYVARVIEIASQYPNVLYCINNETAIDVSWSKFWLQFVRQTAEELQKRLYISDMLLIASSAIVDDYGFDFADLSQSASDFQRPKYSNIKEAHFETVLKEVDRIAGSPVPLNSVKQYGGDIIHWTRGSNEGVDRVWRSIFAGQAGVRFHRPPFGLGLNERAQYNIKSLRMITNSFDLEKVKPHQDIDHLFIKRNDNDAYLMGEEGKVLAVFFTHTGSEVEMDLSSFIGEVTIDWLDTNTSELGKSENFHGNTLTLVKPGEGQWVALINSINK